MPRLLEFQDVLREKIEATYSKAQKDKNYSPFLKNFGSFSVAKLETRAMDKDDFIIDELRGLKSMISRMPIRALEEQEAAISKSPRSKFIMQREFLREVIRHALGNIRAHGSPKDVRQAIRNFVLRNADLHRYLRIR